MTFRRYGDAPDWRCRARTVVRTLGVSVPLPTSHAAHWITETSAWHHERAMGFPWLVSFTLLHASLGAAHTRSPHAARLCI